MNNKKLLEITRNNKKKHNKIVVLAKSKFNSIETLISNIVNEKEKYERIKENIRTMKSSAGLSENNKSIKKIEEMLPKNYDYNIIGKEKKVVAEK